MTEVIDEVPEHFYKYRSLVGDAVRWVERIVLGNEIYFAPASTFNDPFDSRPVFSLEAPPEHHRADFLRMSKKFEPHLTDEQREGMADAAMAKSLSPENIDMTAGAIQAVHNQVIRQQVGLFCVSAKCDDILMWSHYADSHRGICLEFDGMSRLMALAQRVTYSEERVPINPYQDSEMAMVDKAILTKSMHWSYEEEWRLIRYKEGPGVVQFRPHNLTGIILGASANHETVEMVRSWVRRRPSPVNLYCASVSNKRFELSIEPR